MFFSDYLFVSFASMTDSKTKGLITNLKKNEGICRFLVCFIVLALLNGYLKVYSQSKSDSLKSLYPFIKTEFNVVQNDSSIYPFFEKLTKLENGTLKTIRIIHIGDSHIQADLFSGKLRRNFQIQFGNAGRGLVFPYRLARTNEPNSYKSESNVKWEARRIVMPSETIPTGICGITVKTIDTLATFSLTLQPQNNLNYDFNKLTVIHDKGPEIFDYYIKDENGTFFNIVPEATDNSKFTSVFSSDTLVHKFSISFASKDSLLKRHFNLYGIVTENNNPGVLYHMIGVNGAEYRHYNSSEYFLEQLSVLKPDLLLISLGTNDAYPLSFQVENFKRQVDTLLTSIRKIHPNACVILTGPGDSYRKRKYKNKNMLIAGDILKQYALENNIAYWDWYSIMGGLGSSLKWQKKNLYQPDRLHMTRTGYEIQGDLLYEAILKSYYSYKKK